MKAAAVPPGKLTLAFCEKEEAHQLIFVSSALYLSTAFIAGGRGELENTAISATSEHCVVALQ